MFCSLLGTLLAILLLFAFPADASAITFSDVPVTHPYALAIADLAERQAIGGYDDGTFKPEAKVLRQHFAKMIVLGLEIPVSEADVCTFKDVPQSGPGDFYPDNYIAVAYKSKITQGSTPTTFKPLDNIRRTQLITMVVRSAAMYSNCELPPPDAAYFNDWGQLAGFTDKDHGDNVHTAEFWGLLGGIELEGWDLYGYATRGEVAQILLNMVRIFEIRALYVQKDGSGNYTTVQEAVAAAPANSIILVGPGTYDLPATLTISKSVHLWGAVGSDAPTLRCAQTVLRVSTDGVFSAYGIIFQHTGSAAGHGAYIDKGLVDFLRCEFRGAVYDPVSTNGGMGIRMLGTAAGTVRRCLLSNNGHSGFFASENAQSTLVQNECAGNASNGIAFGGTVEGKAIRNTCSGNKLQGITAVSNAQVELSENLCEANLDSGIVFMGDASGKVEHNECAGNKNYGIAVLGNAQPEIRYNLCCDNLKSGIFFTGESGGKAEENESGGNSGCGIEVLGNAQPVLENNLCRQNLASGIGFGGNSRGTAVGNTCEENTYHGIVLFDSARADLKNNICRQNTDSGIVFFGTSTGKAENNECYENEAFGIFVQATANPTLTANNCHDNGLADVRDNRT